MAARPRSVATRHFPPYLIKTKDRSKKVRYRFTTVDGTQKWFPKGTTETQAIQAASAYNHKHRSNGFNLETEVNVKTRDKFNKPLREWLPLVIDRVKSEENLSATVFKKFVKECEVLENYLGAVYSKSLNLSHINEFLNAHYEKLSKKSFNYKLSNIKKVFSYLADESAIESNFAVNKKPKKVTKAESKKNRHDLTMEAYEAIYSAAPLFLKVAMALTLQTTHAVREIYRIKYKIQEPKEGVCGIVWDERPSIKDGQTVYGTLYIHRAKVKDSDASFVAIPVTEAIKEIVELSKTDRLLCPYIVHRKPKQSTRGIAKECDHHYQVHHHNISKEFSKVRDAIGIFDSIDSALRPSYHEIRGLSARTIKDMGISPTQRMAHANAETTKIYTGTEITWNEVSAINVATLKAQ